ncbi:MAG: hypothetical protein PUJ70_02145 [Treponema sp.]|nr:hypothetical protein [Treponema sp.]MDY5838488.1 hypothetical protein [Treponema sp.]
MNRKFVFLPVVFSLIAVLSSCFMAPSSDDSGAVRIALPVVQGVNASVYGSRSDVPAGSGTFIIEVDCGSVKRTLPGMEGQVLVVDNLPLGTCNITGTYFDSNKNEAAYGKESCTIVAGDPVPVVLPLYYNVLDRIESLTLISAKKEYSTYETLDPKKDCVVMANLSNGYSCLLSDEYGKNVFVDVKAVQDTEESVSDSGESVGSGSATHEFDSVEGNYTVTIYANTPSNGTKSVSYNVSTKNYWKELCNKICDIDSGDFSYTIDRDMYADDTCLCMGNIKIVSSGDYSIKRASTFLSESSFLFEVSGKLVLGDGKNKIILDGQTNVAELYKTNTDSVIRIDDGGSLVMNGVVAKNNLVSGTSHGAVISSENTSGGSSVELTGCTFENNVNMSTHGGAIYLAKGVPLTVKGCVFDGNSCEYNLGAEGQGGAIYCTDRIEVTDSTFRKNKDGANGGAAVYVALCNNESENNVDVIMTNVKFLNNISSESVVYVNQAAGTNRNVVIKNVEFSYDDPNVPLFVFGSVEGIEFAGKMTNIASSDPLKIRKTSADTTLDTNGISNIDLVE